MRGNICEKGVRRKEIEKQMEIKKNKREINKEIEKVIKIEMMKEMKKCRKRENEISVEEFLKSQLPNAHFIIDQIVGGDGSHTNYTFFFLSYLLHFLFPSSSL